MIEHNYSVAGCEKGNSPHFFSISPTKLKGKKVKVVI